MKKLYTIIFLPLLLLACDNNSGSGGSDDNKPDAKPDAFVSETKKIIDTTADDTEPVDISTLMVTFPDDSEPVDL